MGKFDKGKRFGGGGSGKFGGGGFGRDAGRPQMFRATCGECGDSCEVPFRPNGKKPVLCRDCFSASGGDAGGSRFAPRPSQGRSFGGGRDEGRPQMFKATCDECGESCEVPFRPSGDKPVYCRECFHDESRGGSNRPLSKEQNPLKGQFDNLNAKLDKILKLLSAKNETAPAQEFVVSEVVEQAPVDVVVTEEASKKKKTAKKATAKKKK